MNHSMSAPIRRMVLGGVVVGWMAIVGCHSKSEPGGPGSVRFAGKEPAGAKLEDWFRLTVPQSPLKIRQGGKADVEIGIDRGPTFEQEVVLNFGDLPRGVAFAPPQPVFRRGKSQVSVEFSAASDTPLGTTTIKVAGNPMHGPQAMNQFKITVEKPEH